MSAKVAIALATYDGAPHLEEQVRSLQAQDFGDWVLYARDDGSSDATPALLRALARAEPRIRLLEGGHRLGVIGNFAEVLRRARDAGAEYVLPCDQDDVWLPSKISRLLTAMKAVEARRGRDTPLLVHSDLQVVDDALRPIHPSFLRFQGIGHEERDPLRVLLVQNFVTGCASLLNRALLDFALPIPAGCLMHDWWLAQCAAAGGAIAFVPEATVLYRQHAANQVGAAGVWASLNPLRADGRRRLARSWRVAGRTIAQAGALHARMVERGRCPPGELELVRGFSAIAGEPPWRRLLTLRRLGIRRHQGYQTAMVWARMAVLGDDGAARPGPGPGR